MSSVNFLNADIVQQQDTLKDLTPEQVQAVVTLGNNLFKKEIDDTTGKWHRRVEDDVKLLYGLDKPDEKMKSHEYLKWAKAEADKSMDAKLKEAAEKGSGNTDAIDKANKEIERLKGELKDAALKGSELLQNDIQIYKKRIADLESHQEDMKAQFAKDRKALEGKISEKVKNNLLLKVGFEQNQALVGVEFDPLTPEGVRNTFLQSKWSEILNTYTPEQITGDDGSVTTQWRDKEGKLVYDPSNLSELATTKSLYLKAIQPVLKQGRQQNGTGTGSGGAGGGGSTVDLRAAKTQVEADEIIADLLLAKGLQRGTSEFAEEQRKIRDENKVGELPLV